MSIQRLPEDVVAQIKSSTAITSLNGVICGLIKNSLDAESTKLTISVDYSKGNCSVEDNGLGILPSEFTANGGIGKLHYTSHFPAHSEVHGHSGMFLASVAALSLLSITSHHKHYHSHNSIQIHNSRVIARHTPSPPDQRLLSFSHGTRTTVRDLFGAMPVRVKQRALAVDKTTTTRYWEHLKLAIVALLLPWPRNVTVSIRGPSSQQTAMIRNNETPAEGLADRVRRSLHVARVSSLFYQAGLFEENNPESWVALKAAAGHLSITGAICLVPVVTKRMQFISIGIQPVSNERGSNILYEEINRVFANSSFGVEEDIKDLDEIEMARRIEDRRYKTEGYTERELKGRKGIEKWPMFHIQINLGELVQPNIGHDVGAVLDERKDYLTVIVDVLKAMAYGFLEKHHFRPVNYQAKKRESCRTSNSSASSETMASTLPSRPASQSTEPWQTGQPASVDHPAASLPHLPKAQYLGSSRESLFDRWSRVKSSRQISASAKDLEAKSRSPQYLHEENDAPLSTELAISPVPPLFNDEGELQRVPFLDVEEPPKACDQEVDPAPDEGNPENNDQPSVMDDDVIWTNPATKRKLTVDLRTGFVVDPSEEVTKSQLTDIKTFHLPSSKRPRTEASAAEGKPCQWIEDLLSSWENPVFEAAEPHIHAAFDAAKLLNSMNARSKHLGNCASTERPFGVEARVSKDALRAANVLAQVDRKFILAKVSLQAPLSMQDMKNDKSLLIIIDQHAADERCRVEAMMADYFASNSSGQARSELIEKFLQYEISSQERLLFERHRSHFEHWGIQYQLVVVAPQPEKQNAKLPSFLRVISLPPSIAERCQSEPRLLIDLLRKEAWKLDDNGRAHARSTAAMQAMELGADPGFDAELHWLAKFHGAPQGILDLINSRACRSAIMFNDILSLEECKDLLKKLADCAFPFQCAHGRPSIVPLVDMGDQQSQQNKSPVHSTFGKHYRNWKMNMVGGR